jgi:hypothetical protein
MERDDWLSYLIEMGQQWLQEQRNLYIARARSLTADEKKLLQGYYDNKILDKVRLSAVDRISNPTFYTELVKSGNPILDISGSAGITFIDCIVIRKEFRKDFPVWNSILFHELVHAVQYEVLGLKRLIEAYLTAWSQNGYSYDRIPFEIQARRLEIRFSRREPPFSVRKAVERELKKWQLL